MSRPVVLVVDPEESLTCQMADDLRARFRGIHVLTANSERRGREIANRLKQDSRRLAIALVDLDTCAHLVEELQELHPTAKRVFLTPFTNKGRAIQLMSEGLAHYYLVKPWQPPHERLHPIVADLLEDWTSANEPKAESIRVYGLRWSPESHELKDFLARNQAPYEWIDLSEDELDERAQQVAREHPRLPVVVLPGGEALVTPSTEELARRIGLKTEPTAKYYDLIVVGGGPAGLAAAVYAASEGLQTVVIEREAPGGQAGCSTMIENYLGFPQGLSGSDLARRARDQAERFHVEILSPTEAVGLRAVGGYRMLRLKGGQEIASRAILLAMGVSYRRLQVPGEERLFGKGVYYGASFSEAVECENEVICVIGGGNSASQAALHFAQYARKVLMVVREPSLGTLSSQYLVERIEGTQNIEVLPNACLDELRGEDKLSAVVVNGEALECSAAFVFIGADPRTDWLPREIVRDEKGYLITGYRVLRVPGNRWPLTRPPMHLETSIPGVFAAGDVRYGSTKRIASAVGQGAAAVQLVHEYLSEVRA